MSLLAKPFSVHPPMLRFDTQLRTTLPSIYKWTRLRSFVIVIMSLALLSSCSREVYMSYPLHRNPIPIFSITKMSVSKNPRWTWLQDARTIMLSALIAATLFTMAHHLFYASLDGRDTSRTTFGQARNINIGTAFAFLVKMCLAVAIGAAYSQLL